MDLFGDGDRESKKFPRGVGAALFVVLALLVWELVALCVGAPYIVPAPQDVLARGAELVVTAPFWQAVGWSLLRVLVGFACGMVCGIALAVPMAAWPRVRAVFAPFIKVIRTVPVVCFILLMLLWVNATWLSAIISALMVLPVAWTNTIEALDSLDAGAVEVARVFRLGPARRLFRLYLPAIAPQLLATAAVGLGLAWKSGITAEVLALPVLGMGSNIYHAKIALEAADIFVWAIVIIVLSLVMESALRACAARFSGWEAA